MNETQKIFLNKSEVAEMLGVSRSSLWRLLKTSKDFPKPVTLLGGRQLFKKIDILQYIERL